MKTISVECPHCDRTFSLNVPDDDCNKEIGGLIRTLRKQAGWTLDDLSKRSLMSKGFLSDIENGKRGPSLTSIVDIADAFGIPASELLKQQEDRSKGPPLK